MEYLYAFFEYDTDLLSERNERVPKNYLISAAFGFTCCANYELRCDGVGWWADGYNWPDDVVPVHSATIIKSLVKAGLLEGNSRGVKIALGGRDGKSMMEAPIPMLWTSEKGRTLLDKITIVAGLVFDNDNYRVVVPEPEEEMDGIDLGYLDSALEAALASFEEDQRWLH